MAVAGLALPGALDKGPCLSEPWLPSLLDEIGQAPCWAQGILAQSSPRVPRWPGLALLCPDEKLGLREAGLPDAIWLVSGGVGFEPGAVCALTPALRGPPTPGR